MASEFEILKKIRYGSLTEQELTDIYFRHKNNYAILFALCRHSRFPENYSLNIVPELFNMDLVRVVKDTRTRPYIRKKAEMEFFARYQKIPLGEKLTCMRVAPLSLLNYFIEEENQKILLVMLKNAYCTEDLILKMINRKKPRYGFYQALEETEWYKRPRIAEAITMDNQAGIKIMLKLIPFLSLGKLQDIFRRQSTHQIVRQNIIEYLNRSKK